MFKLVNERTAWWPVTWKGVDEQGEIIEHEIELKFRAIGRKEYREMFLEPDENRDEEEADRHAMRRILAEDWHGVADGDGNPLPFSWEAMDALLDMPLFPNGVILAYSKMMAAIPAVREKNSAGSRGSHVAPNAGETGIGTPSSRSSGASARMRAPSQGSRAGRKKARSK